MHPRRPKPVFRNVIVVVVVVAVAAFVVAAVGARQGGDEAPPRVWRAAGGERHQVHVNRPAGPPVVAARSPSGAEVAIACSTCHVGRTPDRRNRTPADLDEFHVGLAFAHGGLPCLACHNADDYDTLRLADGTAVEYADVMTLCAQCHGPQARDYAHGAHGGMTGYWDLSRGPRQRNTCVDCHDPHVPAFPKMVPTFKPVDRFLVPREHAAGGPSPAGAQHD